MASGAVDELQVEVPPECLGSLAARIDFQRAQDPDALIRAAGSLLGLD
jgi:hypothetical protein